MSEETLRFEEAMSKLEGIVQKLESGDVPLEDAIKLYKQGMELSAYCHGKLQDAEKQLISIIDDNGQATPFDPSKGRDSNG
ncbi:exodeoxyribonuclease VII small subunit [Sporosarcina sp. Marseille-Q4943]|uniref:exodeoxyribonuclease VII small subunit n=1 Tax=Sporosarcina sp. Marseille-Q4943 TaxID=2942204 RepID=UPI00208DB09E|nr:exodeoxyribonuclease VII small subunit [Sporosarcina sp. Marseille-Q4943]